jgi:hypothetical protein
MFLERHFVHLVHYLNKIIIDYRELKKIIINLIAINLKKLDYSSNETNFNSLKTPTTQWNYSFYAKDLHNNCINKLLKYRLYYQATESDGVFIYKCKFNLFKRFRNS